MEKAVRPKVLLYQSAGFLAIIGLSWINEWLGLTSLIFGNHPYISDFHESTLEMLLVLGVWFLVEASTRRVLEHMRRLEQMARVCAWCRRVKYNGRWMRLEEFLEHALDTSTSHDICHECLEREKAVAEHAEPAESAPLKTPAASEIAGFSNPGV